MAFVFFLLLAAGGLLLYFLRHRRLSARKVLLVGALLVNGLVLVFLLRVLLHDRHVSGPAWVFCFFLFAALSYLFFRIAKRLFRPAPSRARPGPCPPVGLLKDLLAERLPLREQARLAAHLEDCTACQHRVEGLTAGQKSWPGLARKLSAHPASPEPALQRVMNRLKESQEGAADDRPVCAGELPLGFLAPPERPGQLGRLGRYEVLQEIGRGGMGIVLKAFDPSLHRVVAIKVLAPQLATSGVARKRFLREAKAAAAVSHDHIVTIHAVDEANGVPYLVMQYVAGQSLQDRLDKEGPLEPAEVVRIGMQTASGLAAAHGHGIVHRDIKPANILLEEGAGRVKITDFGLARAMDDASLTQSGFVAGSPLYMAPEQARGEALDPRADLFSLGSVLYTMCAGRPPFRAANALAVLRRVCEDVPRPLRETNPEVPDGLAAVVDRLMAKDPADRFQSAAEAEEALGQQLAQLRHQPWVPAPAAANASSAGPLTSVTICPSCGASLHVPERMVGSVVHCAECGKPFRVEEGSEVIQVAAAVQPPLRRDFGLRRKLRRWLWIAGGCAVLLFLLVCLLSSSTEQASVPATAILAQRPALAASPADSSWKAALCWLPAEATLFGAIDLRPFGAATLDDARTEALLRLIVPGRTADRLTPENLGRIRFDRLALACYEGPRQEESRVVVHLDGLALDGRKRVLDFLRQETAGKVRVENRKGLLPARDSVRVSGPELPFALGLIDDSHAFLTVSLNRDAGEPQHAAALKELSDVAFPDGPADTVLSGYNPPWIRAALAEVPGDACGLFLGEIPVELRRLLTEALHLRVCPRTFVCHLRRVNSGLALSLTLNLDKAGADRILQEDLETWRQQALGVLQIHYPALRKEPETLARVGQTLKRMRWAANAGTSVRTEVWISGRTAKALLTLLKRASQSPDVSRSPS